MRASSTFQGDCDTGLSGVWSNDVYNPRRLAFFDKWLKDYQIEINKEKIRFGGINSPERKEIGYRLAKDKLIEKIANNILTCVREKNKDKYRRTVAECFINGESLSSFMVKNGYACDYMYYSKGKYAKEQKYAKANKLGVWKMKYNTSWENKCRKK